MSCLIFQFHLVCLLMMWFQFAYTFVMMVIHGYAEYYRKYSYKLDKIDGVLFEVLDIKIWMLIGCSFTTF